MEKENFCFIHSFFFHTLFQIAHFLPFPPRPEAGSEGDFPETPPPPSF